MAGAKAPAVFFGAWPVAYPMRSGRHACMMIII